MIGLAGSRPARADFCGGFKPLWLIDVTRLLDRALHGKRPTGVDRVGLAYVERFRDRAQALLRFARRWVVFSPADSQRLFDWLQAPDRASAHRMRWLVGRNLALNWQRPQPNALLLNTGHSGLDQPDYARRVRRYGLRPLYFLHDLIPVTFPEYARPGEEEKHRHRLATMLATAQGLVVNSSHTAREVEAYASRLGLAMPPLVVAHLAATAFPHPAKERPMREPYFVVLGTIEPRKNHLLLLNLWRGLSARMGRQTPRLVVIGQRGWECEQVVDMLERCPAIKGSVIELSACNDAALATWLHHAQALLFPSFAEGYGIPLVEALSLSTPVIASDLPVFRELAGNIPDYLDPLDGAGWRQAILDYTAPDAPRRRAQLARMAGWQAPTWAAHFEQVEALMAHCLSV
jgi:glycosyltransferase involved in cell wall biosynthesis